MLRAERDVILKGLDYTQLADAPFSSMEKKHFREYRQYLRNLPQSHCDEYTICNYKIMNFVEWKNFKNIR